jgi:hypothetical protein
MSGADKAVPARAAADILVGARAILNELKALGLLGNDANEDAVYYIAREQKLPVGKWGKKLPIGRFGKSLIASRTKLRHAVNALTEAAE